MSVQRTRRKNAVGKGLGKLRRISFSRDEDLRVDAHSKIYVMHARMHTHRKTHTHTHTHTKAHAQKQQKKGYGFWALLSFIFFHFFQRDEGRVPKWTATWGRNERHVDGWAGLAWAFLLFFFFRNEIFRKRNHVVTGMRGWRRIPGRHVDGAGPRARASGRQRARIQTKWNEIESKLRRRRRRRRKEKEKTALLRGVGWAPLILSLSLSLSLSLTHTHTHTHTHY